MNLLLLVKGDVDPFLFGFLQQANHIVDLVPVFAAADFEMGIVDFDAGLAADPDHLFHGAHNGIRFASLMNHESAAKFSDQRKC